MGGGGRRRVPRAAPAKGAPTSLGFDEISGRCVASMFDLSAREQTALRGLTQAHRKGSATAFSVDALQRRLGTAFATEGARMGGTVSSLDALCKLGLAKRTDGRGPGEVPCRAPGESEPPAAGDAGDAVASPSRGEMLFSLTMAGRKLIRMHRRPHAQAASAGGVAGCGAAIAGSACGKRKVHESSRSGSSDSGSGSDNAMPPINRRLPSAAFKSEAEFAAASRWPAVGGEGRRMSLLAAVLTAEKMQTGDGAAATVADATGASNPKATSEGKDGLEMPRKRQREVVASLPPMPSTPHTAPPVQIAALAAQEAANAVAHYLYSAMRGATAATMPAIPSADHRPLMMQSTLPPCAPAYLSAPYGVMSCVPPPWVWTAAGKPEHGAYPPLLGAPQSSSASAAAMAASPTPLVPMLSPPVVKPQPTVQGSAATGA